MDLPPVSRRIKQRTRDEIAAFPFFIWKESKIGNIILLGAESEETEARREAQRLSVSHQGVRFGFLDRAFKASTKEFPLWINL